MSISTVKGSGIAGIYRVSVYGTLEVSDTLVRVFGVSMDVARVDGAEDAIVTTRVSYSQVTGTYFPKNAVLVGVVPRCPFRLHLLNSEGVLHGREVETYITPRLPVLHTPFAYHI